MEEIKYSVSESDMIKIMKFADFIRNPTILFDDDMSIMMKNIISASRNSAHEIFHIANRYMRNEE
jgi:hypothetical protein